MFPAGQESEPRSSTPVEVPQTLVSLLTANSNAALTKISAASGADVSLRQDMAHLGYSLAFLTGTAQAVTKAKEMLLEQVGLAGNTITKLIEVAPEYISAFGAIDLAFAEMRRKSGDVPIQILPPESPGAPVRVNLGPGPVANVATAEHLIRKKVADIELHLFAKLGRPVPPEKKIAVNCKYYLAGSCWRGGSCQHCHGMEELEVARRASMPEGSDPSVAMVLSPMPDTRRQALEDASAGSRVAATGTPGMT